MSILAATALSFSAGALFGCGSEDEGEAPECPAVDLNACPDGACATNEFSEKVYAAWKPRLLLEHGIDEAHFSDHFFIRNLAYAENGTEKSVRIEWYYVVDWATIAENQVVVVDEPDVSFDDGIRLAVTPGHEQFDVTSLATPAAIQAAFDSCSEGIEIAWCGGKFVNGTGEIILEGWEVIDEADNRCRSATVNAITGEVNDCRETPCAVY